MHVVAVRIVGDREHVAVGVVGVDRARAVAHVLLDQVAGIVVGVQDDQVAVAVGQLRKPAQRIVGVVDREAGLIDALGALADNVVAELQPGAVRVLDLGEQVGIARVAVDEVGDIVLGVGGAGQVALGVVGVGIRRAVGEVFGGDQALGVVGVADGLAVGVQELRRLAERVVGVLLLVPLA